MSKTMIPCISQATTMSTPFEDDVPAFARAGWPAVELWLPKLETYLETHTIDEARALLTDQGIQALAASGQGGLVTRLQEHRERSWGLFRRHLEMLQQLAVPTLIVPPFFAGELRPEDIAASAEALAEAGEMAGGHGVRLALEIDSNASFCASIDSTLALIAQSGSAHVGLCLDMFHYYCGPSKFEDLAYLCPENLAWVQVCDLSGVPREFARDPDRILPGDGDFLIVPILAHLIRIGYQVGVSLEVLNPQIWRTKVDIVADAGLRALSRVLMEAATEAAAAGPLRRAST
jgi:sugar phosphate isomerase/epimerase